MSAEENTSRLIYRHVSGLEQQIALLESQKSALEGRVTALVEALKWAGEHLHRIYDSAEPGDDALLDCVDAALKAAGEGL